MAVERSGRWIVQSVEETGVGVSWHKTDLPQGEYHSSWGDDGVREVVKQFAGEFTLKSGGKVSIHQPCSLWYCSQCHE